MTTFAVGYNVPGYLPESEPWTCDRYAEAVDLLVEEIEAWFEDEESVDRVALEASITNAQAFARDHDGETINVYFGTVVFFLQPC